MAIDQSKLTAGQQQALLAQQAAQSQNAALLAKKQAMLGTKPTGQAADGASLAQQPTGENGGLSSLYGDYSAALAQRGSSQSAQGAPSFDARGAREYLQGIMDNNGVLGQWNAQYPDGYPVSDAVLAAQDYLSDVMASRPGAFASRYESQIASLYDQIMNRPKFQYDVNKDPLFQQYKNQYMVNGQRAMQDAMGQAAALTGGYGSSWGNTAGYQAYQQYLQMLNDRVPELEQRAFDRYAYEGDQMRQNMDLTLNLDNIDYGRYRDKVQDWKDDRAFSYGAYRDTMGDWQSQRAFDYGMYRDAVGDYLNERNFGWNMYDAEANREMQNYWNQKDYDLQVQKFMYEQAKNGGKTSGGGGGGGGGSGKGTVKAKAADTTKKADKGTDMEVDAISMAQPVRQGIKPVAELLNLPTRAQQGYYPNDPAKRKRMEDLGIFVTK